MLISRAFTNSLDVFRSFDRHKIPTELKIQSRDGDISMLEELPSKGLAIVGTRHPQARSLQLLEEALFDLRNSGLIIVSGLARGIDSRAHELSLQYGLRTIALLGCGINEVYPKENSSLRSKIVAEGGLVMSQFNDDSPPFSKNFYHRNALIAGFSKATWVVEAAEVSGTLNTANWAFKLNRDLYATSCFPSDVFYQGNVKLLSQRESGRFPIAQNFFCAKSLSSTWTNLAGMENSQESFLLESAKLSEIQKWVIELQAISGKCQIQALMELASSNGVSLGEFYKRYEGELEAGSLNQDPNGRVEINFHSGTRMTPV